MKRYTQEYFEAFDVKDDGAGMRSIETSLGKFTHEADAIEVCKGRGPYASNDGLVKPCRMDVVIFDSLAEYQADRQTKLRESGLNKLTAEEKAALGL